jgi:hypothetical protein
MDSERKTADGTPEVEVEETKYVLYGVEDVPSPPVCFIFGLQVRFWVFIHCSYSYF